MIVKIQLPIMGDMSKAYVYNEDRTFEYFMHMTPEIVLLMGEEKKVFFEVEFNYKTDHLDIGKRLPDQGW